MAKPGEIDRRVPGYLGRILHGDQPVGTWFQLSPGVGATACHVLADLGADHRGAIVRVDPLQGGAARDATVVQVDPLHDLAVLTVDHPLPACVEGLAATDEVELDATVTLTGVPEIPDPGRRYRHLDATARWAGGTMRDDSTALGRLRSPDLVRGMSGAPVLREGRVIGVVSERYHSADDWLQNTVWVARCEDLEELLRGVTEVASAPAGGFPQPRRLASEDIDDFVIAPDAARYASRTWSPVDQPERNEPGREKWKRFHDELLSLLDANLDQSHPAVRVGPNPEWDASTDRLTGEHLLAIVNYSQSSDREFIAFTTIGVRVSKGSRDGSFIPYEELCFWSITKEEVGSVWGSIKEAYALWYGIPHPVMLPQMIVLSRDHERITTPYAKPYSRGSISPHDYTVIVRVRDLARTHFWS